MKKYLLFCLLIYFSSSVLAQSEIPNLIKQGLEFSYNFQFDKANEIFQRIISKYPSDPRGYHYRSSSYLWTYLSNKESDDYNNFIKYSDETIKKCEEILDSKENDETALYILGANYGFRALAFTKANSSVSALWAVKNANKYLSKTVELYPKNYDAHLGLGLFNYALSLVPSIFKWALKLGGLSGTKEEGINHLKIVYRNGVYSKNEAAYFLSQIYSETLIDYNTAIGYLKQLINKYPGNSLFGYSYAVVLMKNRKMNEAEKVLRKIISDNNKDFKQVISYSNFLIGEILFRKNEFSSTIPYYEKFLSTTKEFDYSGIAYYRIALSYEIHGNREEAKKNYILARNGNLDLADDMFAKRKGELYFDRTLSQNEIKLIYISNMIECGKYLEANNSLWELIPNLQSEKLKAEAYLYLSDINYETGKLDEAIKDGEKAVRFNTANETWIKPFAYYYLARAYYKSGNKSKAADMIDAAEDFSDFDYQVKLKGYTDALKEKLN